MKVREVVEKLGALNTPEVELLIALPGNRFSPVTLVEPFTSTDDQGGKRAVAILYPHPRDVGAPAAPGAAPGGRSELAQAIDAFFDFLGGPEDKHD